MAITLFRNAENRLVPPVVEFGEDYRPANRSTIVVKRSFGPRRSTGVLEESVGQPVGLPCIAYERTVQFVASGLQSCIEDASAGAAHLRVVRASLDLHFLPGFDG